MAGQAFTPCGGGHSALSAAEGLVVLRFLGHVDGEGERAGRTRIARAARLHQDAVGRGGARFAVGGGVDDQRGRVHSGVCRASASIAAASTSIARGVASVTAVAGFVGGVAAGAGVGGEEKEEQGYVAHASSQARPVPYEKRRHPRFDPRRSRDRRVVRRHRVVCHRERVHAPVFGVLGRPGVPGGRSRSRRRPRRASIRSRSLAHGAQVDCAAVTKAFAVSNRLPLMSPVAGSYVEMVVLFSTSSP